MDDIIENGIIPSKIGRYSLRGTIGTGSFSVVKLAVDENTNESFACKIIPRTRIAKPRQQARFELEIRILQQMKHPNIVQLIDILKDNSNYYVIMEFCSNGELFQYIVDHRFLSENEAKSFLKQLISSLLYVHSNGAVHRDLKPENLLLDDFGQLKLSDFGFSRFANNNIVTTPCGSPCYASPECISGKPYDGKKSDIWSCGVILYAMLTGQLPWTKKNQRELFKQIQAGDFTIPIYLSHDCQDLLRRMMAHEPNDRPTAQEVYNHKWLSDAHFLTISTNKISNLTLKRIDQYFNREISSFNLPQIRIRSISSEHLNFDQVKKYETSTFISEADNAKSFDNKNEKAQSSKLPTLEMKLIKTPGLANKPITAFELIKRQKLQLCSVNHTPSDKSTQRRHLEQKTEFLASKSSLSLKKNPFGKIDGFSGRNPVPFSKPLSTTSRKHVIHSSTKKKKI